MLDVHVLLEQDRVLEVAVDLRLRTVQIAPVHAVHRVHYAVKARPVVADVPHPLEQWRNVDVPGAEAKHGEQYRQNWTDKYCELVREVVKRREKRRRKLVFEWFFYKLFKNCNGFAKVFSFSAI